MKKALFLGKQVDKITYAQREPFIYYRQELLDKLDLSIEYFNIDTLTDIWNLSKQYDSEIIFIQPFWGESPEEVKNTIQQIRLQYPQRKLIFIDPWAQASSTYFNVLPYVDKFLKRQCYKNLQNYYQEFIGGSMFTDYLAKQWGLNFDSWRVDSQVPTGCETRIMAGWNLGTSEKYKKQLKRAKGWLWSRFHPKKIDVFCRMSLGSRDKKEWYYEYRKAAIEALQPLASNYQVAISGTFSGNLVPNRQYQREIKSSRIVVSPFGWGENCWRDFEAVAYNCLLVKPSMNHINTKPNLFIDNETYVSVKWDFSDVVEKCCYYLENPDEAERIIKNASKVYEDYFQHGEFLKTIEKLIK